MSFANTGYYRKYRQIAKKFDFVEAFNSCEPAERNIQARLMANRLGIPGFGGSDSHKPDCIGTAFTRLPERVTKESELIRLVKKKAAIKYGGHIYKGTTKEKIGKVNNVLIYSFWVYNKVLCVSQSIKRHGQKRYLNVASVGHRYYFKKI